MLGPVDGDLADIDDIVSQRPRSGAPEYRLDPQHKLSGTERFRQVIVGAKREPAKAIGLVTPCREHKHRYLARCLVSSQRLEHIEPRKAGEHEIEYDQRRELTLGLFQRFAPMGGCRYLKSGLCQVIGDERDDIRLIVDDEDSLASWGLLHDQTSPTHGGTSMSPLSLTRHTRRHTTCPVAYDSDTHGYESVPETRLKLATRILFLLLSACAPATSPTGGTSASPGNAFDLVVLSTTDVHGWIRSWDYYGDSATSVRGLTRAATVIDSIRAANPGRVLLLDAGDLLQGNPFAYVSMKQFADPGTPIVAAITVLRYDGMAIGNHEYNYGVPYLERAVAQARFPMLSANTYLPDGKHKFRAWTIVELRGVKIG